MLNKWSSKGDYLLALKENQPHLLEDVQRLFAWADRINMKP
ncbi:MAG TPA: hypothetical protein PKH77_21405 [Anaerolineae bacterium]|nr:hypothetical protein [Anaerolineae bacterium]